MPDDAAAVSGRRWSSVALLAVVGAMSRPLIELDAVSKSFHGGLRLFGGSARPAPALNAVSLRVEAGQTLGIVGESGSGKSTLLRVLLRLVRPSSGRALFDGKDVWAMRGSELLALRRQVQAVFQDPMSSFNPRQTVAGILAAPLEVHRIGTRASRRESIAEVLQRVGLGPDLARRYPHQLSGGQRQRVAIARAIILRPAILLADEPTSALDVSVQAQVLNLFKQTRAELGLTCIFVSHNLGVIRYVSDTVAVMRQGVVEEQGPADAVFRSPRHEYTRALLAAVPDPANARGD
jgi:peptide/nickel transport system ATP-binding protein